MDNEEESKLTIDKDRTKEWKNKKGLLHRIGGPAIEEADGNKLWYQNGELHRIGGPAVEYMKYGDKYWYQKGKKHRIDGPAIEYGDGVKFWFLMDKMFNTKEEFFNALTDEEKVIALFSEDFLNG